MPSKVVPTAQRALQINFVGGRAARAVGVKREADLCAPARLGFSKARRAIVLVARFLLAPSSAWRDEGTWLVRLADMITRQGLPPTVVGNGGDLVWHDTGTGVNAGGPAGFVRDPGAREDLEFNLADVVVEKDRGPQTSAGWR